MNLCTLRLCGMPGLEFHNLQPSCNCLAVLTQDMDFHMAFLGRWCGHTTALTSSLKRLCRETNSSKRTMEMLLLLQLGPLCSQLLLLCGTKLSGLRIWNSTWKTSKHEDMVHRLPKQQLFITGERNVAQCSAKILPHCSLAFTSRIKWTFTQTFHSVLIFCLNLTNWLVKSWVNLLLSGSFSLGKSRSQSCFTKLSQHLLN